MRKEQEERHFRHLREQKAAAAAAAQASVKPPNDEACGEDELVEELHDNLALAQASVEANDLAQESSVVCDQEWAWDLPALNKTVHRDALDWIEERSDGYYCKICSKAGMVRKGKKAWTKNPCTNKDAVKAIAKHKMNQDHVALINASQASQTSIPDAKVKLNPQDMLFVQKRMRTLYMLAKIFWRFHCLETSLSWVY